VRLGVEERIVELQISRLLEGGGLVGLAVVLPGEVNASADIDRETGLVALGGELLVPVGDHGADLGGLVALLVAEAGANRELPAIRGLDHQVSHGVLKAARALLVANNDGLLVKKVLDLEEHSRTTTAKETQRLV